MSITVHESILLEVDLPEPDFAEVTFKPKIWKFEE